MRMLSIAAAKASGKRPWVSSNSDRLADILAYSALTQSGLTFVI